MQSSPRVASRPQATPRPKAAEDWTPEDVGAFFRELAMNDAASLMESEGVDGITLCHLAQSYEHDVWEGKMTRLAFKKVQAHLEVRKRKTTGARAPIRRAAQDVNPRASPPIGSRSARELRSPRAVQSPQTRYRELANRAAPQKNDANSLRGVQSLKELKEPKDDPR